MRHRFPARLRQLRLERDLLQRDLERALNLSPGAASQYERGLREPGLDLLVAMANYLGVSLDDLVGRTRPENARLTDRPWVGRV